MDTSGNTGYLLQHLAFLLGRRSDQILQERLGLGFSQFKILMVLEDNPNIRQKAIAQALGQTEASISRQIKLMYDDGLLQSRVRPENRREHITTPTTKGLRLVEEALRVLNQFHQPMFGRLNSKQQKQLHEALAIMHDYACESRHTNKAVPQ